MRYHEPATLRARGVELPAPDAVLVGREVDPDRLGAGAVLHPGARIEGAETVIAPGARIGGLGPVTLIDCAVGRDARVERGSAERSVLLPGATLGPEAHAREGTILEEGASTGHAVGLKQTILMPWVALGSQINFCDALMAGGRSRSDHSEVGSGFIHFNFTPFGRRGDKATASLFGDVSGGVLLDRDRIFLGGAGGVVGPVRVGYGTVLGAGSVYRRSQDGGRLVYSEAIPPRSAPFDPLLVRGAGRRLAATRAFVGELRALACWYRAARLPRAADDLDRQVLEGALRRLEGAVAERIKQGDRLAANLRAALDERPEAYGDEAREREEGVIASWSSAREALAAEPACAAPPKDLAPALARGGDHLEWVAGLAPPLKAALEGWLSGVVAEVAEG